MAKPKQVEVEHEGSTSSYWWFDTLPTRKELQKFSTNIVPAQERLRPLLELGLVTALIDCEWQQKNDYLHHRGSGLDTIMVRLCKQHNTMILVDMTKFYACDADAQAILLGRIYQNRKLAKKYGVLMFAVVDEAGKIQLHPLDQYV